MENADHTVPVFDLVAVHSNRYKSLAPIGSSVQPFGTKPFICAVGGVLGAVKPRVRWKTYSKSARSAPAALSW